MGTRHLRRAGWPHWLPRVCHRTWPIRVRDRMELTNVSVSREVARQMFEDASLGSPELDVATKAWADALVRDLASLPPLIEYDDA